MKKILFITIVIFFNSLSAQTTFQKVYGDGYCVGRAAQQTMDNGFIISGEIYHFSFSSPTYTDIYLGKTNLSGDLIWSKTIKNGDYNLVNDVIQSVDGGYLVVGQKGDPGYDRGVLLIKMDGAGNIVWSRVFTSISSQDYGKSVIQTSDGGYVIAGTSSSKMYLIKLDGNGNHEWNTRIQGDTVNHTFRGHSIEETNDGGFIVTGLQNLDGSTTTYAFLIKTDSLGNLEWNKRYGKQGRENVGHSVKELSDGSLVVVGSTASFSFSNLLDVYLFKTDSQGNELWAKSFGGIHQDVGYSLGFTNDGGYIIGGESHSFANYSQTNSYIIKTDNTGTLIWSRMFGRSMDSDACFSVQQTNDNGYMLFGTTAYSNNSHLYLIKTDSLGHVNGGCNEMEPARVSIDSFSIIATIQCSQAVSGLMSTHTWPEGIDNYEVNYCNYIGINEIFKNIAFSLFPCPSDGNLILECKLQGNETGELLIYSLTGQVLKSFILTEGIKIMQVDASELYSGLYLYEFKINGQSVHQNKLTIIH